MSAHPSDALVMFGVTGDLAHRKLFPALYHLVDRGLLHVPVVGVASSPWDTEQLRERIVDSLDKAGIDVDEGVRGKLLAATTYVRGDYEDPATYDQLAEALGNAPTPVIYLAVPPSRFPAVIEGVAGAGLTGARIVVEKPFGRDVASAHELNGVLRARFPESQIFRIDHFLGKEAVQNLSVFRFANALLEPVWNCHHIDHVEVTMAESFGVEGRGRFYEQVGTLRDVVQNHLFQTVCQLAMEPPTSNDEEPVRDEVAKVLRAARSLDPADVVRGQYEGYRDEEGVEPGSEVETFVAVRMFIDSWRWAGVPWILRAGKAMAETVTEAVVTFKQPPQLLFHTAGEPLPEPNVLRFRVKPDASISLQVQRKVPGPRMVSAPVQLQVSSEVAQDDGPEAYERLLGDALAGDARLFAREDSVLEAWRIVQPVLDDPGPVHRYPIGTWGPDEARRLVPDDDWLPCGEATPCPEGVGGGERGAG
jgi:glucose-6-phosphate 1-dehydrogenase